MHTTKTTLAYEKLKELLHQGALDKNRCIPVAEIAGLIDFGRAPVLDALRRLESEGFLAIVPQKGIMVLEMTVQDMREINDIRMALETFTMGQVAPAFTAEHGARLREILEKQRCAKDADDAKAFMTADESFHLFLSELTGNTRMIHLMQRLRSRFYAAGLHVLKQPERMRTSFAEHVAVIGALEQNDGEAATAAMLEHLRNGRKLMF